jgi:hypothetical protein
MDTKIGKQLASVERPHLHPTPQGVYHAFSCLSQSPGKALIRALLGFEATLPMNLDDLRRWSGLGDSQQALELLDSARDQRWLRAFKTPRRCPEGSFEQLAPQLLARLSADGKVLLADGHGFHLASSGFEHGDAEELSALSADLAGLHERRPNSLPGRGDWRSSAWGTVDDSGRSVLGFWPVHIGEYRFVLVISGRPRLHNPAYVKLIWLLNLRYSSLASRQPNPIPTI